MRCHITSLRSLLVAALLVAGTMPAWGQASSSSGQAGSQASPPPPIDGRVTFLVNTATRNVEGLDSRRDTEFATMFTFRTPEVDASGLEAGVDLRYSRYTTVDRPDRASVYDGFAGARFGAQGQFRVRAGHMWLPDLGTAGALAGGLFEYRHVPATSDGLRFTVGGFSGAEPLVYDTGYASGVRKSGGYVALQRGFMQRHVVGYVQVKQSGLTERNLLTFTNYIPGGSGFFLYQAAEVDMKGPAEGTASSGLSYFLVNARVSAGPRVELNGTYNRGRSIDARRLTEDVLHNRPLTQQAIEGLQYASAGGRVILRVARQADVWTGYYQDRNNRDDEPTGRLTVGGHAGNVAGTGLDLSASMARYDRPTGPYNSTYFSVGRGLGRMLYVSADYSTSLSVIRFVRSDGVIIETRPSTKRYSGSANATLNRLFSLMFVADYTRDEGYDELRLLTGLTYRMR
ncbi:MAG: hypothetical protein AB7H81_17035 [Vicinamibacterales bacterium]